MSRWWWLMVTFANLAFCALSQWRFSWAVTRSCTSAVLLHVDLDIYPQSRTVNIAVNTPNGYSGRRLRGLRSSALRKTLIGGLREKAIPGLSCGLQAVMKGHCQDTNIGVDEAAMSLLDVKD
ncbi:hypothetical protein AOLI_G00075550 [Acnodon oligacanthus]